MAMFERLGQLMAKKAEPTVHIDMKKVLQELGLQDLPAICKPKGEATDKLATKAEKLRKTKRVPFVYVKLASFVPPHASESNKNADSEDEEDSETMNAMQKVMGVEKATHTLTFL